jgi:hypothetical protein
MTNLMLLFTTVALGVTFLFIPVTEPREFFPFSAVQLSMDTWFYFLFEKVIVLIMSVVILNQSTDHRPALWVFVSIQGVEILDYLLFYGEPWSPNIPSWNILKVALFGLAIVMELPNYKKHGTT